MTVTVPLCSGIPVAAEDLEFNDVVDVATADKGAFRGRFECRAGDTLVFTRNHHGDVCTEEVHPNSMFYKVLDPVNDQMEVEVDMGDSFGELTIEDDD